MAHRMVFDVFAFLLGLCVGSFANVVAYRAPKGLSIVKPRSYCPHCRQQIRWYDNLPVLSYLLLGGRCRYCRNRISFRYPLFELLMGVLFLLLALRHGFSPQFIPGALFLTGMVLVVRTDLEHWLILDEVSVGGAFAGVGLSLLPGGVSPVSSLVAAGGAFLIFYLIRKVSLSFVRGRPGYVVPPEGYEEESESFQSGMGWGDVKLAAMIGAFLGVTASAMAFFSAFLLGSVVGVLLILLRGRSRRVPLPFGPFMAAGGALGWFYGSRLWTAYTDLATSVLG
ncbi:prepilin peptidase [Candidatus Fermentibacteria bacterium]|nr:prepilin peptidase [Candidatus Fermentibacteria bacterium]